MVTFGPNKFISLIAHDRISVHGMMCSPFLEQVGFVHSQKRAVHSRENIFFNVILVFLFVYLITLIIVAVVWNQGWIWPSPRYIRGRNGCPERWMLRLNWISTSFVIYIVLVLCIISLLGSSTQWINLSTILQLLENVCTDPLLILHSTPSILVSRLAKLFELL